MGGEGIGQDQIARDLGGGGGGWRGEQGKRRGGGLKPEGWSNKGVKGGRGEVDPTRSGKGKRGGGDRPQSSPRKTDFSKAEKGGAGGLRMGGVNRVETRLNPREEPGPDIGGTTWEGIMALVHHKKEREGKGMSDQGVGWGSYGGRDRSTNEGRANIITS